MYDNMPQVSRSLLKRQVKPTTEMDMRKWTSAKKDPDGSEIPMWLNKPLSELPTKGYICLQGLHGRGVLAPVYFRNIKVKTLPSK